LRENRVVGGSYKGRACFTKEENPQVAAQARARGGRGGVAHKEASMRRANYREGCETVAAMLQKIDVLAIRKKKNEGGGRFTLSCCTRA